MGNLNMLILKKDFTIDSELLSTVYISFNLFDFCLEKILTLILTWLGFFRDDQRLNPSRNARLPINKAILGPKNKKPLKRILVLKY